MLSPEKRKILNENLNCVRFEYEHEMMSQDLRDKFPEKVPADEEIEVVKENYKDKDFMQPCVLTLLAMVPVYGIEGELIERLEIKLSLPKTKEVYQNILRIYISLLYQGHPRGMEEFEKL